MNKSIMVKAGIILGFFALIFIFAFGCEAIRNNDKTPTISDGDTVYLTVDDIKVTNRELYDEMLIKNGISYLIQYAEELLLADYLDEVTPAELAAEQVKLTYGTDDEDLIALYQEDPELVADAEKSFEQSMILLGLDPTSDEDLEDYLGLSVAKTKFTRDYLNGLDSEDPLYIEDEDVQNYYDTNIVGDIYVLDIRFHSDEEAEKVLNNFNIVPNFESGKWGIYDPALNEGKSIEDTRLANEFSVENTKLVADDEAFALFVEIYNYMNPNNQLPANLTEADYMTNYADMATRNKDELLLGEASDSNLEKYVDYLYDTLDLPEDEEDTDALFYSHSIQTIGDYLVLAYKVDAEETKLYAELTDTEKAEWRTEYVETKVTSSTLQTALEERWNDNELEIFDPVLKLQYEFTYGIEFDNNGHDTLVAKIGDHELTADGFFAYMTQNFGMYTAVELASHKYLVDSTYFTTVYGEDQNVFNNDSEKMAKAREDIQSFKSYFAGNGFAGYGLSSTDYTWEEFLILYLQSYSEEDVIRSISVVGTLQNYLLNEAIDYDSAVAYMTAQEENYFSLNMDHILLFLDLDGDFTGDSMDDHYASLDDTEKAVFNDLVQDFQALVLTRIGEGKSLTEIVEEYQDSLIGDPTNEWAELKEYGFFITTQELGNQDYLSTNGSEDPFPGGGYDLVFIENAKRIYDAFLFEYENAAEKPTTYNDTQVFRTDFGVHYVVSTQGTDFVQPTAEFDNAEEKYVAGTVGTTVLPNQSQLELYLEIQFDVKMDNDNDTVLPDSLTAAFDMYYAGLYENFWPSTENESMPLTIATIMYGLDNDATFATDNEAKLTVLEDIVETLTELNYPELYYAD